tara:strand:+ start:2458 stop:2763 length:306 start_codon:yes stop_codon:yes gene_type:complete
MRNTSSINFNQCILSNDLWTFFINKIGISKARLAVRQALDLQSMQGANYTLPILIIETCGAALISSEVVKTYIGLNVNDPGVLLIYSYQLNSIQLLRDNLF